MKTEFILTILVLLLAACNIPSPMLSSENPTATLAPEPQPASTATPGLIMRAHVTSDGVGLAGIKIYRRFPAYPAELIAITDGSGFYESDFIGIPGDEMVSIEAELDDYTFASQ